MTENEAVAGFGALAQDTRLRILRLLVQAGPLGRAAGDIALAMKVSPSNVSFHLKELERAGLLSQRREARSIIYSADYQRISDLIRFLMQDCCAGHPEICAPALADPCCAPAPVPRKSKTRGKVKINV
jgi:ArsR family transcriptional regulator, arsenate/arsenite/antimonite-responsive transcriptional repressor